MIYLRAFWYRTYVLSAVREDVVFMLKLIWIGIDYYNLKTLGWDCCLNTPILEHDETTNKANDLNEKWALLKNNLNKYPIVSNIMMYIT